MRDCKEHGHDFKPRYDLISPKWLGDESRLDWLAEAGVSIEHIYEKRYVRDVCTKCGAAIERHEEIVKAA